MKSNKLDVIYGMKRCFLSYLKHYFSGKETFLGFALVIVCFKNFFYCKRNLGCMIKEHIERYKMVKFGNKTPIYQ